MLRSQGRKMAVKQNLTLSHTARKNQETYFYVFNKEDGGWVIVGGDEVCQGILAYSGSGSFSYDDLPANVVNWLNGYEKEISHSIAATTSANGSRNVRKSAHASAIGGQDVNPMIKTAWDQTAPYWNMTPKKDGEHCLTGCVATAMAQVMNYWQWPEVGVGSKSYYDWDAEYQYGCKQTVSSKFFSHHYDWVNMKDRYGSSGSTNEQQAAVAQLMYDCGVAVSMNYGTSSEGGSAAWTEDVETALIDYFSYDPQTVKYVSLYDYSNRKKHTDEEWARMMYKEVSELRPVIMGANDSNVKYGHEFIIDGYAYRDGKDYFHFNFGWSGDYDAFWTLTSVQTGSGNNIYKWTMYQDAVIGIQPKESKIYTVTLADDGSELRPSFAGGSVSLPNRSLPGYTFEGWNADLMGIDEPTTDKPSILPVSYVPNRDVELYPIFSYVKNGNVGGNLTEVFSEDFADTESFGNNTTTTGSSTTWNGNDNFAIVTAGYKAGGALRLGASKKIGSVTTRSIGVPPGAKLTVSVDVKGWTTVEGRLCIGVTDCEEQVLSYSETMSGRFETLTATFVTTTANPQVTISTTSKRAFIDNIVVTTGSGTPDKTFYCSYLTMSNARLEVTPAKWATFYAPDDVELEAGTYAYAVTSGGTDIQRVLVAYGDAPTQYERTIPAHTPVIVYKDVTDTYTKNYDTFFSVTPSAVDGNCLVGTLVDIPRVKPTTDNRTNYVLQLNPQNRPAWFSVVYDDKAGKYNTLAANHAYLSVLPDLSVKDIFSEVVTEIITEKQESDIKRLSHNLQGQTINDTYKGIIIRNRQKILQK
ncbi:MAG: C10 family peptidase [Bacteroidaceae bacterium]|nr:C10 family peptidase [Bacteroidaceae bacterium]